MTAARGRGRLSSCPPELLRRILLMRAAGARYLDITTELNDEQIPTPGGGQRWYPSHLSRPLDTTTARRMADNLRSQPTAAS